jgi:tRNA pseudouridine38-40 synthase
VSRNGEEVVLDIAANGFLYHMVRNIVGSLLETGKAVRPVEWIAELLQAGDRNLAGTAAAPDGLCLMGVRYPQVFKLPEKPEAFPRYGQGQ